MPIPRALSLLTVLAATALAAASTADAQPAADPRVAEVEQHLRDAAEAGASGVLLITLGDETLIETGFGSASCTEDEPVTPDHVFMIGSITKELTQILGFILEEAGALSLEDALSDHLETLDGALTQVTLRQLIEHTGGLLDLIDADGRPVPYSVTYDYQPVTREELIARASLAALLWAPGEQEQYSNLGYQLLAAAYETTTGSSFPDLLRRHIYGPAGMTGTDFWFSDSEERVFADGCLIAGAHWGNPIDDEMWGSAGPSWNLMGAGGLLSTAESLGKFFQALGDGRLFDSPEAAERYRDARMSYSERRQQLVMGPAGSNGIFNAVGFWAQSDQLNVILITNRADHTAEGGLFRKIMQSFPPETASSSN